MERVSNLQTSRRHPVCCCTIPIRRSDAIFPSVVTICVGHPRHTMHAPLHRARVAPAPLCTHTCHQHSHCARHAKTSTWNLTSLTVRTWISSSKDITLSLAASPTHRISAGSRVHMAALHTHTHHKKWPDFIFEYERIQVARPRKEDHPPTARMRTSHPTQQPARRSTLQHRDHELVEINQTPYYEYTRQSIRLELALLDTDPPGEGGGAYSRGGYTGNDAPVTAVCQQQLLCCGY